MNKINNSYLKKKSLRYERKYIYNGDFNSLLNIFGSLKFNLNEQFQERRVNSIYYDNNNFKFAKSSINGEKLRKKYRIRFYGENKTEYNLRLEIKHKIGDLGFKEIYKIRDEISVSQNLLNVFDSIESEEKNKNLYIELSDLRPVLSCSYMRRYYISECLRFRLTYDYGITYQSLISKINFPELKINNFSDNQNKIIEIKYGQKFNQDLSQFISKSKLRLSKNSKYINGLIFLGIINNKIYL